MKELRRLNDSDASEPERRLLSSWGHEQPSAEARARVVGLLTAGAAGAAGATSVTGSASSSGAGGTGATGQAVAGVSWTLGKALTVGALGAIASAATIGGVTARSFQQQRATEVTRAAVSARVIETAQEIAISAPPPTAAPNVVVETAPSSPPSRPSPPSPPSPSRPATVARPMYRSREAPSAVAAPSPPDRSRSNVLAQVTSLDRVHNALAAGDGARALALLDEHDTTFPGGALAQEATVLRVEALAKIGRRAEAKTLARGFIEAHPSSAHVARIREIVEP